MEYEDFGEAVLRAVKEQVLAPLVVDGAAAAAAGVVREIETAPPRTGRPRRNPRTGEISRSSAPGEAPAEGTGAYMESWTSETVAEDDGDQLSASAYSEMPSDAGVPLGADLEVGLSMERRPHIGPAMPEIAADVADLLRGVRQ